LDKITDKPSEELLGPIDLSEAGIALQQRQVKVEGIFRELALMDTSEIQDHVSELLAGKIAQVRQHRPDLSEIEATMVASRLMKQLILCYKAELERLL
jgi:hypothetical protein